MRRVAWAFLTMLLAACQPSASTTAPTPPATAAGGEQTVAASKDNSDHDDRAALPLVSPDSKALLEAASAAAASAGLTPKPVGPGPQTSGRQEGRRRLAGMRDVWNLVSKPSRGKPYQIDFAETFYARLPWATLDTEGNLKVSWETRSAAPAAILYLGMRVEEDPVAPPRYREHKTELLRRSSRTHSVEYNVSKLLGPRYDVNDIRGRGYGEISWQVEQYNPASGTTELHDGRTAFRLEGEGEAVSFVQLPTVVLGPLVHQVDEQEFIVSLETDVPTTAALAVAGGMPRVSRNPGKRHEIAVKGLKPGHDYLYQVAVSDGAQSSVSPPRQVTTRSADDVVTVAIMSDSRSGNGSGLVAYNGVNATALRSLFIGAYRQGAQAVFFPGDLIDGYVPHPDDFDYQLRAWLGAIESVHGSIPVYTGMGNHEALVDLWSDGLFYAREGIYSAESHFAALMVNPSGAPTVEASGAPQYEENVYSTDLGDVHFVMLNTNYWYTNQVGHERLKGTHNREGFLMDHQLEWLERDLKAARKQGAKYIIVMGHEPAFPVGGHAKDAMWWHGKIPEVNAMRERFWKILAEHGVLAYVSGDEHNYSRSLIGAQIVPGAKQPVYSVISGGCGAPYYSQDTPSAYKDRVQAFSAQQHFTMWTFPKKGPPVLQAIGVTGDIIETVELTEAGQQP